MEKESLLTQAWEISTTTPSEELAAVLAKALLDKRLAACVQMVGPIRSFYRWKESIQEDIEWKLSIKTIESALSLCREEVARLHPYEVPEWIAKPILHISPDYENWLQEQVSVSTALRQTAPWHLRVARLPSHPTCVGQVIVMGSQVNELEFPNGPQSLTVSFEEVQNVLSKLPNLHFEPDGSFVWGSTEYTPKNGRAWQLDCMVYDRDNRVEFLEIKGKCDLKTWDLLTQILSGVECLPLTVHWVEKGIWISESDFRKCIE